MMNRTTWPRKYSELTLADAIQADCNVKATSIILQGLPPEVYALVSNDRIAKELWERIQLLMQGTSLTKQERECKTYDEFDKFAYKKGETLRDDPIDAINHMCPLLIQLSSHYDTTLHRAVKNSGKQRTVICYNCKGEGHMSKQCTKPKRKRDDSWFKDKVLLVQAQANGQILHEEELAFLADPGTAEVALMTNLSHYGLDALAEVHNPDNVNNNMINQKCAGDAYVTESQQAVVQNSNSSAQQDALILFAIMILESEETLMLAEESRVKMLLKQPDLMVLEKKVNTTPVDYAVLNQLSQDFEK
ncbi:retrovirus-related pol polyprotein from transposon TNT 1-94 [Tanacetum coccineum]